MAQLRETPHAVAPTGDCRTTCILQNPKTGLPVMLVTMHLHTHTQANNRCCCFAIQWSRCAGYHYAAARQAIVAHFAFFRVHQFDFPLCWIFQTLLYTLGSSIVVVGLQSNGRDPVRHHCCSRKSDCRASCHLHNPKTWICIMLTVKILPSDAWINNRGCWFVIQLSYFGDEANAASYE